MKPAVFLDRDGVINVDHGYIYLKEDFQWIPGIKESIKFLNDNDFLVFVITNQSGIARGYYQEYHVEVLHDWINKTLSNIGAKIDKFYYCPYHPESKIEKYRSDSNFRKPYPGMILKAFDEWDLDKNNSFLIGDKNIDIQAARNAGIKGFLFNGNDIYNLITSIVIKKEFNK